MSQKIKLITGPQGPGKDKVISQILAPYQNVAIASTPSFEWIDSNLIHKTHIQAFRFLEMNDEETIQDIVYFINKRRLSQAIIIEMVEPPKYTPTSLYDWVHVQPDAPKPLPDADQAALPE